MSRTALGWRSHSGWAVLVVVRGTAAAPGVLVRQHVELVADPIPRQPYHAIVEGGLTMRAARALIARAEQSSVAAAVAATESVAGEFDVEAAGIVARRRNVPDDLEQILASHALLHAAEGQLFELALAESAAQVGLPACLLEPDRLAVGHSLEVAGKVLGPPWRKDHKLAAAAALAALD